MVEALIRDLRYAVRGLARTPSFSVAAILTLAIGIGATTAVFSVVYGILIRPLPFPTADRLVRIVQIGQARGGGEPWRAGLTPDQIAEWRTTSRSFAEIGSYSHTALSLTGVPIPIRLNGATISVPLFRAVGVAPHAGRVFGDEDEITGNERVVVLSHRLWTERFGAATETIGRAITLGGRPYRVIGVMPADFGFPSVASQGMSLNANGELSDAPEFWIPMVRQARPAGPATGGMTMVMTFALLKPGVTVPEATAEAGTLMPAHTTQRFRLELANLVEEETRGVRRVLLVFQAAVLFVLLIACANVTNLLLARAAARKRELSVRLAIGASRPQLVRHALCESLIIGVCGGAGGAAIAALVVLLMRRLPPYVLPRLSEIRVDGVVLGTTAAIAITAGLLVGLWTALRVLGANPNLATVGRGDGGSSGRAQRPSRVLVVVETAAGVLLLAGAALLLTSFVRLAGVDRGFAVRNVFSFRVSLPARLQPPASQYAFHDSLAAALTSQPGVRSSAAVERALGSSAIGFTLFVDGRKVEKAKVAFQTITPGLFDTLGIPLRGRDFTPADRLDSAAAAIVNESFARQYFPWSEPLGASIGFQSWKTLLIVGVARDTKPGDPASEIPPTIFLPNEMSRGFGSPTYLVRGPAPQVLLPALREAVRGLDPDAVVFDAMPLETFAGRPLITPRFYGLTAAGLAGVAVVLAALGLYGVLSYSVSTRTREFGIRIALGATSRRVVGGVMRETAGTVLLGVAAGLAGAYYSSRFLESLLFGVRPHDPATLAAVTALFLAVAALACYVPARRATAVNPIAALRAE